MTFAEARILAERWRYEYNHIRRQLAGVPTAGTRSYDTGNTSSVDD